MAPCSHNALERERERERETDRGTKFRCNSFMIIKTISYANVLYVYPLLVTIGDLTSFARNMTSMNLRMRATLTIR